MQPVQQLNAVGIHLPPLCLQFRVLPHRRLIRVPQTGQKEDARLFAHPGQPGFKVLRVAAGGKRPLLQAALCAALRFQRRARAGNVVVQPQWPQLCWDTARELPVLLRRKAAFEHHICTAEQRQHRRRVVVKVAVHQVKHHRAAVDLGFQQRLPGNGAALPLVLHPQSQLPALCQQGKTRQNAADVRRTLPGGKFYCDLHIPSYRWNSPVRRSPMGMTSQNTHRLLVESCTSLW